MQHAYEPQVLGQAWTILQLVVVAFVAGWTAERVLDTEVHTRGLSLLSGLFGLYVGPRLLEMTGWPTGPEVAGQPVLGAIVGAMVIGSFLKLASLGTPSAR
jgi:uncharacterized membrane protein YeaQ/YmgE (transglycosylase-associated protein family)